MAQRSDVVVGLDIGTTKIAVVVAQIGAADSERSFGANMPNLEILGVGTHPSNGLRKGVVINIEATVESIKRALKEAEAMSGCEITQVYAGIAGSHIQGLNSHGIVGVKNREVTAKDIENVIDAARAVHIPADREILHTLPQEYVVDEQDGIRDPLGMAGVRLEAKVHIVTGSVTGVQNVVKSAQKAGLGVADIVLEPLASADAVLYKDEKELGVALVDIGGGTTDITVFHNGAIKHTCVISVGGNHITSDISEILRTPYASAEELKKKFGAASMSGCDPEEYINVPLTGGRVPKSTQRGNLIQVIQPRVEEIMEFVKFELVKSGYDEVLTAGVVLTGGAVLLTGMSEVAESILKHPVRIGYPLGIGGLVDVVNSPTFATGVGLVTYGARVGGATRKFTKPANKSSNGQPLFDRVKVRMSEWFAEHF